MNINVPILTSFAPSSSSASTNKKSASSFNYSNPRLTQPKRQTPKAPVQMITPKKNS